MFVRLCVCGKDSGEKGDCVQTDTHTGRALIDLVVPTGFPLQLKISHSHTVTSYGLVIENIHEGFVCP